MRTSQIVQGIVLILLLVLSGWIVSYYWNMQTLDAIRVLPRYIMYVCLGYVILQILKRFLNRRRYWWDWLYYIGLAAAMLPTFLGSKESEGMMHILTDFGTPFLVIPVVLDIYALFKKQS